MVIHNIDVPIVVTSGVGSVQLTPAVYGSAILGEIKFIGIKAPTSAVEYDISITDVSDYILYAENDLIGDSAISLEKLCNSLITLSILNASVDGSFTLRLYIKN